MLGKLREEIALAEKEGKEVQKNCFEKVLERALDAAKKAGTDEVSDRMVIEAAKEENKCQQRVYESLKAHVDYDLYMGAKERIAAINAFLEKYSKKNKEACS